MEIVKVIAITLAVFLHHANGRATTSTSNDNIEKMLDLAEQELNTVLNETNENPAEREENPADILRLSEPDSSSYEEFSSDNMIQRKEASPALRHRISNADPCYTGYKKTAQLPSGEIRWFPVCREVAFIGCGRSIAKYGMRKCKGSDYETVSVSVSINGANKMSLFPKKCSCAV